MKSALPLLPHEATSFVQDIIQNRNRLLDLAGRNSTLSARRRTDNSVKSSTLVDRQTIRSNHKSDTLVDGQTIPSNHQHTRSSTDKIMLRNHKSPRAHARRWTDNSVKSCGEITSALIDGQTIRTPSTWRLRPSTSTPQARSERASNSKNSKAKAERGKHGGRAHHDVL